MTRTKDESAGDPLVRAAAAVGPPILFASVRGAPALRWAVYLNGDAFDVAVEIGGVPAWWAAPVCDR